MTRKKEIPQAAYRFAAPVSLAGKEGDQHTFSGNAYTGDILNHPFWGHVAFDLSTITAPKTLPMLVGHDRDRNAGFSESVTIDDNGIAVAGKLLSNHDGERVVNDASEGFPWQMSVHIEPDEIAEVEAGYEVNGRKFEKGGVVFKNSTLREISFTPTGVDANTSAHIYSFSYHEFQKGQSPESQEGHAMTKEEAAALTAENEALKQQFAASEAKNAEIQQQFAALQAEKAAAEKAVRETAIEKLFSDTGIEAAKGQKEAMLTMNAEQFSAVSDILAKAKPAAPAHLFSEHNTASSGADNDPVSEIVSAYEAQGV